MSRPAENFLETADFIGARLCRDAIWAGKRCNWVGAVAASGMSAAGGRKRAPTHRACGADLYGGTSGIAAFLARLYASTGDEIFHLTAEGAIRQALARLDDFAPGARSGFYKGLTGIAYVLSELAEIFGVEKFAAMALLILEDVSKDDPGRQGPDVLAGSAGAIPALLEIHRKRREDFLLEMAVSHGEHLLSAAVKSDAGWSWQSTSTPRRQRVGFARGAAGIAWALLELSHATGQQRFRLAAEQAFRWEQDAPGDVDENQPDSCLASEARAGDSAARWNSAAWSDGASGDALAKLRAHELTRERAYMGEAQAALRMTTMLLSDSSSAAGREDFSLAHGLAGAAEVLLRASRVLEDESHRVFAERVGRRGIERYREDNLPWPCGTPEKVETPNLMSGLAGIGYFYLRLHDASKTPSLLMVSPEPSAP